LPLRRISCNKEITLHDLFEVLKQSALAEAVELDPETTEKTTTGLKFSERLGVTEDDIRASGDTD
jgi:hypothetical protein